MHLSFAARIRDTDHVLQNNLPNVWVLQSFDEITGIVRTSGNDDASEQHALSLIHI